MKEALTNILSVLIQNGTFLMQVSADVSALKTVVAAFGPEAQKALEEQMDVERNRIQQQIEKQQMILEALRVGVSRILN